MSAARARGSLAAACWPAAQLEAALAALADRIAGASRAPGAPPAAAAEPLDRDELAHRLPTAAGRAGLDAHEAAPAYGDLDATLARAAPAVVVLDGGGAPELLLVLGRSGRDLRVLPPGGGVRRVTRAEVRAALCRSWEEPLRAGLASLLERLAVDRRSRERVAAGLLADQLHAIAIGGVWTLRASPGRALGSLAWAHGLPQSFAVLLAAHAAQYALWLASWGVIGRAALAGDLSPRTLLTWGALLLALLPLRLLVTWTEGRLSIAAGALLKERLMLGAVRLQPEEVRHEGSGAHLGRVIESEAVELLGLSGGLMAALALLELVGAAWVLAHGAAAAGLLGALAAWLVALGLAVAPLRALRARWVRSRLALTRLLVERMAGHETRLAQQARANWHDGEDEALLAYHADALAFDRIESLWAVLPGRGWLVLALTVLAGAIGSGASATSLAVSLGGVLVGYQAFAHLAGGLGNLVGAGLAWDQVVDLFRAAARVECAGRREAALPPGAPADVARGARPLLACGDVTFRHAGARGAVLEHCGLEIQPGERLLLEGASGSGKSTLVSLVSGLRRPASGRLELLGRDLDELGRDGWRRMVATAPQFHENHVFTGSLAFNLLMGRRWPPRPEDVVEAEGVCRSLGLGDLLARMPGGVHQSVGETGWQLSHGERNRVYLARALLQGGALLVLDESFGALDPDTLQVAMEHVLSLDAAVCVVGHSP